MFRCLERPMRRNSSRELLYSRERSISISSSLISLRATETLKIKHWRGIKVPELMIGRVTELRFL